MGKFDLNRMITVDDTGAPKAPNIEQLQDKDLLAIYMRDKSRDKQVYMAEVGVMYYLGNPNSPPQQRGLSDQEALKEAIENYGLPKDFHPDSLLLRLIAKYKNECFGEAATTVNIIQKGVHLSSLAISKINEYLNKKLSSPINDEDIPSILVMIDSVNKRASEIPALVKALSTAYENLRNEEEETMARGNKTILSSMDADEDY